MSFPKYEKYKDSGVEWLGDVPEHWEIRKISQLFRAGKGKNGQLLTKEFCADNEGIYPVYSGQTENEGIMGYWKQFEFDFGENGVLFSTTVGAKAMDLRQLFGRFSLSQNCMIIWATSNLCKTRFFYYHFQPLFKWQRSLIPDHMQPSFRMEDLYSFIIALPPLSEQTAIAEFLDRETAKIDESVAEQQRLIELLKEKRRAVISHAVTRGLNPNVKIKPSGIEWIGDVPEHWEIKRLKYNLKLLNEKTGEQTNPVALENIEGWTGRFIATETKFEGEGIKFKVGDILFGKLRPYLAKVYCTEFSGEAIGDFLVMRPFKEVNSYFAQYQILNRDFISIVDGSTFGSRMPRASWEFVGGIVITRPPILEQEEIVLFLDQESAKFDTLTAEAQHAIDLLQERRTALISAAVTGKIDVRQLNKN